ncbi:MAG: DUF2934 domain-containing protein [Nitrospirae bacterium]|nr:DUF2934 domain-containing protein [Nitrospirota bacterium]
MKKGKSSIVRRRMDINNEITKMAYELYEKSGRIEGRDLDNWLEAEKKVLERHSSMKRIKPLSSVTKEKVNISNSELRNKILELYPEIQKSNIDFSLRFNKDKNAYIVRLKKNRHTLTTYLEKNDAEECIKGIKCVYLGIQIGQFIKNFEIIEKR